MVVLILRLLVQPVRLSSPTYCRRWVSSPSRGCACSRRCSRSINSLTRDALHRRPMPSTTLHRDMMETETNIVPGRTRRRPRAAAATARSGSNWPTCSYAYPAASRAALKGLDLVDRRPQLHRHRRRHRRGQDHAGRPHPGPARPRTATHPRRRRPGHRRDAARLAEDARLRAADESSCSTTPSPRTSRSASRPTGSTAAVERAARMAELHDFVRASCPRATTPGSASAACASPAGSGSGSASRARSTTTPTC